MNATIPTFVDFFAGSGLVTQGVKHACVPVWSNDICPKRAAKHGDIAWAISPQMDTTAGQAFSRHATVSKIEREFSALLTVFRRLQCF